MKLNRSDAVLIIIDAQEKLMPVIDGADEVARNLERLVRGAHVLGVPVLITEQYVKGLGPTIAPLRKALEETTGYEPLEKLCFSACGAEPFLTQLDETRRQQILIAGVETHVCVYQTAMDLLALQRAVTVIADAVSSRTAANRDIGIRRMTAEGARLSSTEMALFELTGVSATDEFRAISRLIK